MIEAYLLLIGGAFIAAWFQRYDGETDRDSKTYSDMEQCECGQWIDDHDDIECLRRVLGADDEQ